MFSQKLKDELKSQWQRTLFQSPIWLALENRTFSVNAYEQFLIQTYHYTRRSCLIQASALPMFQTQHRELANPFLKHALEEEGHYRLCLMDLAALDRPAHSIEDLNPLPETEGYIGFAFNRIQNINPLAYLGYLYQLEFMAVEVGPKAAMAISRSTGLSEKRFFSFLHVHAHEDQDHIKDLDTIVDKIPDSERGEVRYTALTAASLYSTMINAAFHEAENAR